MKILTHILLASVLFLALPAFAFQETFTVNSIADTDDPTPNDGICGPSGGPCTLRAAITEASAHAGADIINFGIAGGGVHTITLTQFLPDIIQPVTIDGYSQPGSKANTNVTGAINAVPLIQLVGNGGTGNDLN